MNPDDPTPTQLKPKREVIKRMCEKVKKESVHVVRTSIKLDLSESELEALILEALDLPEQAGVIWNIRGGTVSLRIEDCTEKVVSQ